MGRNSLAHFVYLHVILDFVKGTVKINLFELFSFLPLENFTCFLSLIPSNETTSKGLRMNEVIDQMDLPKSGKYDVKLFALVEHNIPEWSISREELAKFERDVECGRILWFCAKVSVSINGVELGTCYLGGCAYTSLEEFAKDNYCAGMVNNAVLEAETAIKGIVDLHALDMLTCAESRAKAARHLLEAQESIQLAIATMGSADVLSEFMGQSSSELPEILISTANALLKP